MKTIFRTCIILLIPFIFLFLLNESVRNTIKEIPYHQYGFTTINSSEKLNYKCTWYCHNNTAFCKMYHVKHLNKYYSLTDRFYYGEINMLKSFGDYGLTNIAILVIGIPFLILYFIIKGFSIRKQIQIIKQNA